MSHKFIRRPAEDGTVPDDPPGACSIFLGFLVGWKADVSVVDPMANSSMLVLPSLSAPRKVYCGSGRTQRRFERSPHGDHHLGTNCGKLSLRDEALKDILLNTATLHGAQAMTLKRRTMNEQWP